MVAEVVVVFAVVVVAVLDVQAVLVVLVASGSLFNNSFFKGKCQCKLPSFSRHKMNNEACVNTLEVPMLGASFSLFIMDKYKYINYKEYLMNAQIEGGAT